MEQRVQLIADVTRGESSISELCRQYGISRPVAYKWLRRFQEEGPKGLAERSHVPHLCPHAVSEAVAEEILGLRRERPTWGPRKLLAYLEANKPKRSWPAASTIGELLKRAGLVHERRKRRRTPPYTEPFAGANQPNAVWAADFKGWFRTMDGVRCDPLTITDAHSRYLLRCLVVDRTETAQVQAVFDAVFRECGLPEVIHTDNGAPFASYGLGALSRLSIWWIKLGIIPERSRPGHPEENGRHERMHLTLKQETADPPAENRRRQQQRFDRFRKVYNEERPHEALGQVPPATLYQVSPRLYTGRVATVEYPASMLIRRVSNRGHMSWKHASVFVSETLAGEDVGLEPIDDRYYRLYFAHLPLAVFDRRELKVKPSGRMATSNAQAEGACG
jgi:transposase InsO family protein